MLVAGRGADIERWASDETPVGEGDGAGKPGVWPSLLSCLQAIRRMTAWHSKWLTKEQIPMTELLIEVPEDILVSEKTDAARFSRELLLLASIKLYELGRMTSGRAAELAGLSRLQFLMSLDRYQVFPLSAELDELEQLHAQRHHEY